jgi:hypothetical protein
MKSYSTEGLGKLPALIETPTDKEAAAPVSQAATRDFVPALALPSTKVHPKVRLGYTIRFALGIGVILSWALPLLGPTSASRVDPPSAPSPFAQQMAFTPVLDMARTYCPPQARVLMLSNNSSAGDLADYFIYPQRKDMPGLDRPLSAADLDAHAGGCLIYYGQMAGQLLDPFRARLKEIICSGNGCLYGIER